MTRFFFLAALSLTLITSFGCGDDGGSADTGSMDAARDTSTSDTGDCGPNTCGACEPACTPVDQCVGGSWDCNCLCEGADVGPLDTGVGDTGTGDAGPADTSTGDSGADMCATAQRDAADFLAVNKSCTVDEDCVQASGECFGAEEACCTVYMSAGYDMTAWDMLLTRMRTCSGGTCACCRALPAPAGCNAGVCGPRGGP